MPVQPLRPAPLDMSGGFFVLRYSSGGKPITFSRIHVAPFVSPANAYISGTPSELLVADTVSAVIQFVAPCMPTAVTIEWTALWQTGTDANGNRVVRRVRPDYNSDGTYQHESGGNVTPSAGADAYTAGNFILDTVGPLVAGQNIAGRARIRLVGSPECLYGVDRHITANASGTVLQQFVDYLTNGNRQVVGHDGTQLVAPAHLTSGPVKNLRTRSMVTG